MATSGEVEITIADGAAGTIVVPSSKLQVVIGTCSSGTANAVVATRNPRTLQSTFGYGPLPEAAAMTIAAGGAVLAIRAATNTAGAVATGSPLAISDATTATPIVITCAPHGLTSGAVVTIASVGGNTAANGTFVITVLSATTFSLNNSVGAGAYTSGGTATYAGTMQSGTGTSVVTFTGAAYDDLYPLITVTKAGTIGTTGIQFTVSLDGGRTTGPSIPLGTSITYVIPQTNVTVNFSAGTLVLADTARCYTTAPTTNTAGILAALTALADSQYGVTGFGSMHIVYTCSGADATTIQGYLNTLATGFLYTRAIVNVRDGLRPVAWGGAGETNAVWAASILADFSAVDAKRVCAAAGHYNMASQYPNPAAGLPRYRRNLGWAQAAREVQIPPQRHSGRVKDGALATVIIDPINDPADGFLYHDERTDGPSLDYLRGGAGRFSSGCTRIGKPGLFIANPLLLSPLGSDFKFMPLGKVMDIACGLVHQVGQDHINDDLLTQANGTLQRAALGNLQSDYDVAIATNMTALGMISAATVAIDPTTNVALTSTVSTSITINGVAYVLQENVSIAYGAGAPS